jgi:hypothetical protein
VFGLRKFRRCLFEENVVAVAKMAAAQLEAWGNGAALLKTEDRLRDEDCSICQVFGKNDVLASEDEAGALVQELN